MFQRPTHVCFSLGCMGALPKAHHVTRHLRFDYDTYFFVEHVTLYFHRLHKLTTGPGVGLFNVRIVQACNQLTPFLQKRKWVVTRQFSTHLKTFEMPNPFSSCLQLICLSAVVSRSPSFLHIHRTESSISRADSRTHIRSSSPSHSSAANARDAFFLCDMEL